MDFFRGTNGVGFFGTKISATCVPGSLGWVHGSFGHDIWSTKCTKNEAPMSLKLASGACCKDSEMQHRDRKVTSLNLYFLLICLTTPDLGIHKVFAYRYDTEIFFLSGPKSKQTSQQFHSAQCTGSPHWIKYVILSYLNMEQRNVFHWKKQNEIRLSIGRTCLNFRCSNCLDSHVLKIAKNIMTLLLVRKPKQWIHSQRVLYRTWLTSMPRGWPYEADSWIFWLQHRSENEQLLMGTSDFFWWIWIMAAGSKIRIRESNLMLAQ